MISSISAAVGARPRPAANISSRMIVSVLPPGWMPAMAPARPKRVLERAVEGARARAAGQEQGPVDVEQVQHRCSGALPARASAGADVRIVRCRPRAVAIAVAGRGEWSSEPPCEAGRAPSAAMAARDSSVMNSSTVTMRSTAPSHRAPRNARSVIGIGLSSGAPMPGTTQ